MNKVSNWQAWHYYQENGCQVMRSTGKSKCGRTPDAQACVVCNKMACLEHAVYLQVRALSGAPIRVQMCTDCMGERNPSDVLSQLIPPLVQELAPDIERMKKRYARLQAMETESQ